MAEIIQDEKQKGGKKKPKKHSVHIDMTPMVDLMCLLITFFMLTTAFSKPKVMDIVLPEKLKDNETAEAPKIATSRTMNIILGDDNKVYWYPGRTEDPENLPPLTQTDFSADGIRKVLIEKNLSLARKLVQFDDDILTGKIKMPYDSIEVARERLKKDDDTGPIVLIKAHETSQYKDLVDIFDEMSICGIASYVFTDMNWMEERMMEIAMGITPTTTSTQN
jgi:biopolymer transport protein ExbD